MNYETDNIPETLPELQAFANYLVEENRKLQEKVHFFEEQIRLLKNEIFGRKSEKSPASDHDQLTLFNEPDVSDEADNHDKQDETVPVPAHTHRKRGRKPLPADLPRVDVVHDIDESEKVCPCGCQRKRIGEETCEKLRYIPAELSVERHIRPKYACPQCEGVEDDGPTVKIAPAPAQLIPKSIATPSLVSHIVTSKYEDGLPLYRLEKQFDRLEIELGRATMAGWMVKAAAACQPLLDLTCQAIRSGPLVNIDETTVQVLNEPGKTNTSTSYMWVFRGGDPVHPSVVFQYQPTRAGSVPIEFLGGFKGYIQTDAYSGYDALGRRDGIIMVGCFSHARRHFMKVIQAQGKSKKTGMADEAIAYIGKLYAVEKKARENHLSPEQIVALRQQEAKPVLDEFKAWLDDRVRLTPPKGLLGKAIRYTLNQWPRLIRYIENGLLRPDNNVAENAIRPFVIGRKNWLFSAHPNGAAASACLYSLIETAKANGHKAHAYLQYVFDRLPLAATETDYRALLPQSLDPAALKNHCS